MNPKDPTPEPVSETAEPPFCDVCMALLPCNCMGIWPYSIGSYPGTCEMSKTHPSNGGAQYYRRDEIDPLLVERNALRRELEEVRKQLVAARNEIAACPKCKESHAVENAEQELATALQQLEERTKERDAFWQELLKMKAALRASNDPEHALRLTHDRDTALAELERVTKERDDLGGVCILPEVTQADALIRMERAEVERAQLRADLAAAKGKVAQYRADFEMAAAKADGFQKEGMSLRQQLTAAQARADELERMLKAGTLFDHQGSAMLYMGKTATEWLQIQARADAGERIVALTQPYPLRDVLKKLADAARHLLDDHNCDVCGHEGIREALQSADRITAAIDAASEGVGE